MTLYYNLVFLLLSVETAIFLTLIFPFPAPIRRGYFSFISHNPLVAKLQYGMKIAFVFTTILFIDSVNRVYRVQLEASNVLRKKDSFGIVTTERSEVLARKFYSQRNMYLCGFTLFLSLILNRTFTFMHEIMNLEDEVKLLKRVRSREEDGDVSKLREELECKDKDIKALRSQMEGLSKEYNRLGDHVAGSEANGKKKDH